MKNLKKIIEDGNCLNIKGDCINCLLYTHLHATKHNKIGNPEEFCYSIILSDVKSIEKVKKIYNRLLREEKLKRILDKY